MRQARELPQHIDVCELGEVVRGQHQVLEVGDGGREGGVDARDAVPGEQEGRRPRGEGEVPEDLDVVVCEVDGVVGPRDAEVLNCWDSVACGVRARGSTLVTSVACRSFHAMGRTSEIKLALLEWVEVRQRVADEVGGEPHLEGGGRWSSLRWVRVAGVRGNESARSDQREVARMFAISWVWSGHAVERDAVHGIFEVGSMSHIWGTCATMFLSLVSASLPNGFPGAPVALGDRQPFVRI